MDHVPLSEVLIQLRADLLAAQREGEGKDLRFVVEDAEVELQIVATKEKEGKGGVKVYVFNAEAGGKASEALTQKLRLKLRSVNAKGDPVYISGKERR